MAEVRMSGLTSALLTAFGGLALFVAAPIILFSLRRIGPTEVGLVTKRLSGKKLTSDNPVALNGEAGYQAELLMPGLRWKMWPLYKVEKFPWVQVPAGEILHFVQRPHFPPQTETEEHTS